MATLRSTTNDIAKKAKPFLQQIEGIEADIETLKSNFMLACKGKRKLIRECFKTAKDEAGLDVDPLKGIVKHRRLAAKIQKIPVDFDMDEAAAYRELERAFGPLGAAAASRAGYGDGNGAENEDPAAEQKKRDHEAGLRTVGRGPAAQA